MPNLNIIIAIILIIIAIALILFIVLSKKNKNRQIKERTERRIKPGATGMQRTHEILNLSTSGCRISCVFA